MDLLPQFVASVRCLVVYSFVYPHTSSLYCSPTKYLPMKILSSALVLVTSLSKLNFGLSQIPDQDLVQIASDGKDLGRTAIAASSSSLKVRDSIFMSCIHHCLSY